MYSVSTEFRNQLQRHTRVEHIRGTIGGVSFDDSNVLSMSYSNRCSNTDDVTLGLAYIGQLQANFVDVPIARKNWKTGKKIILEWGVEILEDDEIVTEWVPVGVFYISSAEWTDSGVQVVANDVLSKLDKPFGNIQTSANTIGGFASFACQQCGVEFALTTAQARALPNGSRLFKLYKENDIKTWRDFVAWLATTAAGFVTATRDGKVTIKSFKDSINVDQWGTGVRIAGSVFSDYDNEFAGVYMTLVNMKADLFVQGDEHLDTDNYIKIGADPFITSLDAAQVIADVVQYINWTPFETSLLSNLIYDLGDLVTCINGIAGEDQLDCCIMSIDWTLKELTKFKGFGADPSLSAGKSKTDKALNGVNNSVTGNVVDFSKYINSTAYTIGATEKEIARLHFALAVTQDVEEWTEIKFQNSGASKITIKYYLDNELIAEYTPVDSLGGGGIIASFVDDGLVLTSTTGGGVQEHTTNYHYHMSDISAGLPHTWSVTVSATDGEITIPAGDVHVVLWAPGMIGEEGFNGIIEASDTIPFLPITPLELFGTMSDSATVTTGDYSNNIITENGDNLTDETGDDLTTVNIDDLPDADTLDGSEYIPIVQNGATVKTTAQDVANLEE